MDVGSEEGWEIKRCEHGEGVAQHEEGVGRTRDGAWTGRAEEPGEVGVFPYSEGEVDRGRADEL